MAALMAAPRTMPPSKKSPSKTSPSKKTAAKKAPGEQASPADELIARLPPPGALHHRLVALTVLDSIDPRRFRAFHHWRDEGAEHFRYDHGNGDMLDAFFSPEGHLVRGFDHESPASPFEHDEQLVPGLYQGLPEPLARFTLASQHEVRLDDGAAAATFAAWFVSGGWHAGEPDYPDFGPYDSDGAAYLLGCLTPDIRFLEQRGWPSSLVARVMAHQPPTDDELRQLSPEVDAAAVGAIMAAAGYGRPFPFG